MMNISDDFIEQPGDEVLTGAAAAAYLRSNGIDVDSMVPISAQESLKVVVRKIEENEAPEPPPGARFFNSKDPIVGTNPKDLVGSKKPDLSLVPPAGILLEAQAMMDGAAKYGPYNWRENPVQMRVYIAACMRHLQQLLDGEDIDPISNTYHVGHARACLGILADAMFTGNLIDDRPSRGPAGDLIRHFEDKKSF